MPINIMWAGKSAGRWLLISRLLWSPDGWSGSGPTWGLWWEMGR